MSLTPEAFDLPWAEQDTARRAAADIILAADPMEVPDVEGLRQEIQNVLEAELLSADQPFAP